MKEYWNIHCPTDHPSTQGVPFINISDDWNQWNQDVAQLYCWDPSFPPTLTLLKEAAGVAWKLTNFCHSTVLNSEAQNNFLLHQLFPSKVFPLKLILSQNQWHFQNLQTWGSLVGNLARFVGRLSRCATERCLLLCWADSKAAYKATSGGKKCWEWASELPSICPPKKSPDIQSWLNL